MDSIRASITDKLSNKPLDLDAIAARLHDPSTSGYPLWLQRTGGFIYNTLWSKLIWNPLVTVWSLLGRYSNMTFWIIASIVIGILVGYYQPEFAQEIEPLGTAFIRMIKIIAVPLVFSSLVVSIAGHSTDISTVGKLAIKCIIYFEVITVFALAVGLIMVNLIKPGVGIILPPQSDNSDAENLAGTSTTITWYGEMFQIIPENFFIAAVNDKILSVVFCAALFACATIKADSKSRETMLSMCNSILQVIFKMVGLIMNYAPIAVGASMAATVGTNGIGVLASLGKFIGAVYAAFFVFLLFVLLPITLVCRIPVFGFLKSIAQPWLIAFVTASSEAALPRAMEKMREFGCPDSLVSFVIPAGYSFNLDGATVYLSLATIFCAQAGGIDLPIKTQLAIIGTQMISSKGVAAVPRSVLVVLAGSVAQYDLPMSAVTMIMGVDAILDMGRASLNMLGNALACCVMSRFEGEFRGNVWIEEERERRRQLEMKLKEDVDTLPTTTKETSPSFTSSLFCPEPAEIMVHHAKPKPIQL